jgi:capsid protein
VIAYSKNHDWASIVAASADQYLAQSAKQRQQKEVASQIAEVQARYEAAYWNRSRSYLPGFIQSAREDINTLSRQEIIRRIRYFEKNSGVLQKVLTILSTNIIGSGLHPTPITSNSTWNKKALDWWNPWAETADLTGHGSVYDIQDIAFRSQNVDGDFGIELTENAFGRPALNLVEAHRITTGSLEAKKMEAAGYRVVDGVIIDSFGRPLVYTVSSDFDAAKIAAITASNFVFYMDKQRAGQYRGISLFHGAVLDLHDLDDLQKFEMLAAKDTASVSKIFQTAAGAVTVDGNGVGASLNLTPSTPNPTTGQRAAYYRQTIGGETLVTFPGDEYKQIESKRPSAAMSGFWDKLEIKFVQASGLSYAALVDYKGNWSGSTLRAAVTSDNRLFSIRTRKQAAKSQRIWEYAINWAITHGELPPNPDFRNVRWHPPRRATVDVGNESGAMLDELKGAVKTYELIHGENGDDWRDRLEQRAIEEAFIEMLSKKYDVPAARIASFAQERLAGVAPDAVAALPAGTPGSGQQPEPDPKQIKP